MEGLRPAFAGRIGLVAFVWREPLKKAEMSWPDRAEVRAVGAEG
jgi:hypothetical protein